MLEIICVVNQQVIKTKANISTGLVNSRDVVLGSKPDGYCNSEPTRNGRKR
jgi:hypothetical protein